MSTATETEKTRAKITDPQSASKAASALVPEVAEVIRSAVNLHHLDASRFTAETSLRDGGLELDSVDILEIIVAIEHKFGVKVDDAEMGKKYFRTIGSVAELIQLQKN
jgi:acyl carrier protein